MKKRLTLLFSLAFSGMIFAQRGAHLTEPSSPESIFLRSAKQYHGICNWEMIKFSDAVGDGKAISSAVLAKNNKWRPAIIPGTVLNSLVADKVYPEPYFEDNNRRTRKLIP